MEIYRYTSQNKGNAVYSVIACIIFCILLIVFCQEAMLAAQTGFSVFVGSCMPALFPFFVLSETICSLVKSRKQKSGKGTFFILFLLSAISGAPSGTRLSKELCECNNIRAYTKTSALLNFAGPMFISGTLCISFLGNTISPIPIFLGQYLSSVILLRFGKAKLTFTEHTYSIKAKQTPIEVFTQSIFKAVIAMAKIGGTVIFFMVLIAILSKLGVFQILLPLKSVFGDVFYKAVFALTMGALEMTCGGVALSDIVGIYSPIVSAIAAFTVTFGGICIMLQAKQFGSLNTRVYIRTKFLQGLLSAFIAFISGYLMCILFPNSQSAFISWESAVKPVSNTEALINLYTVLGIITAAIPALGLIFVIINSRRPSRKEKK